MVFFFIFFFQFITLIYQAIGVRGTGYCGFITAFNQFDGTVMGILIGLVTVSIACAFTVCAIANFLLLTKVRNIWGFRYRIKVACKQQNKKGMG